MNDHKKKNNACGLHYQWSMVQHFNSDILVFSLLLIAAAIVGFVVIVIAGNADIWGQTINTTSNSYTRTSIHTHSRFNWILCIIQCYGSIHIKILFVLTKGSLFYFVVVVVVGLIKTKISATNWSHYCMTFVSQTITNKVVNA